MGSTVQFVKQHVGASIVGTLGIILAALGYADQAQAIMTTFEPWQLQALGAALFAVFVVMVLVRQGQTKAVASSNSTPESAIEAKLAHRRKVIADGRKLVTDYNRYSGQKSIVTFLNCYEGWPAIRAHFDNGILKKIENGNAFVVPASGSKDGKLSYVTDELDRLEREWDLA